MKIVFVCLVFLSFAKSGLAQYFTLSPEGFISESKTDYVVIDVPGAKQNELYTNVLNAINSLYSNPQKGLTMVPGESINLNAYQKKAFKSSAGVMTYDYDADYTLSFLFKDGRIRVNSPTFEAGMQNYNGTWSYLDIRKAFFKKDGEVKSSKNYNQVNKFFNGLIKDILDKSGKIDNW